MHGQGEDLRAVTDCLSLTRLLQPCDRVQARSLLALIPTAMMQEVSRCVAKARLAHVLILGALHVAAGWRASGRSCA